MWTFYCKHEQEFLLLIGADIWQDDNKMTKKHWSKVRIFDEKKTKKIFWVQKTKYVQRGNESEETGG